jgi:uncharacterized protein
MSQAGAARPIPPSADGAAPRIAAGDWERIERDLDDRGFAVIDRLLAPKECEALAALYGDDGLFRKHVIMAQHGYGRGDYKYFAYPLPPMISTLRTAAYPHLAQLANRWNAEMNVEVHYPLDHDAFLKRCHEAGQIRPTPLLLRYGPGDFNCLHQDLYGEHVFPLQMAILLSAPDRAFTGGEFILTEQRPRMQSRATVVPLHQGDAVIFPVRHRPAKGTRGFYRLNVKHGVSELRTGQRFTLGIIFHDAN